MLADKLEIGMAKQARTKLEVIERLNAEVVGDSICSEEAVCLLTDALLLAGMDDVVTAYLEAKARIRSNSLDAGD